MRGREMMISAMQSICLLCLSTAANASPSTESGASASATPTITQSNTVATSTRARAPITSMQTNQSSSKATTTTASDTTTVYTPKQPLPRTPSYQQFAKAIRAYSRNRWGGVPPPPSKSTHKAYLDIIACKLSLEEQAMFLANVVWETVGLQFVEEIACKDGGCEYGQFYGRGYIQLTWDYNYREASRAIWGDDRLMEDPGWVASEEGAWKTALWYWQRHVQPRLRENAAVKGRHLGYSIRAINGSLECCSLNDDDDDDDDHAGIAANRLAIYNGILEEWGMLKGGKGEGTLKGCIREKKHNKGDRKHRDNSIDPNPKTKSKSTRSATASKSLGNDKASVRKKKGIREEKDANVNKLYAHDEDQVILGDGDDPKNGSSNQNDQEQAIEMPSQSASAKSGLRKKRLLNDHPPSNPSLDEYSADDAIAISEDDVE